jgi:hypothetical protein
MQIVLPALASDILYLRNVSMTYIHGRVLRLRAGRLSAAVKIKFIF